MAETTIKTDTNNYLMELFDNTYFYENYKDVLDEPLDADYQSVKQTENDYPHYQECNLIEKNGIKQVKREHNAIIKPLINCLYFVYTDFGKEKVDDKYWFFIGKLKSLKDNAEFYFTYEVGCSGTGFGLGETSILNCSKSKELLMMYGLTDRQRNIIFTHLPNKT